jgi:hypothetical protein
VARRLFAQPAVCSPRLVEEAAGQTRHPAVDVFEDWPRSADQPLGGGLRDSIVVAAAVLPEFVAEARQRDRRGRQPQEADNRDGHADNHRDDIHQRERPPHRSSQQRAAAAAAAERTIDRGSQTTEQYSRLRDASARNPPRDRAMAVCPARLAAHRIADRSGRNCWLSRFAASAARAAAIPAATAAAGAPAVDERQNRSSENAGPGAKPHEFSFV